MFPSSSNVLENLLRMPNVLRLNLGFSRAFLSFSCMVSIANVWFVSVWLFFMVFMWKLSPNCLDRSVQYFSGFSSFYLVVAGILWNVVRCSICGNLHFECGTCHYHSFSNDINVLLHGITSVVFPGARVLYHFLWIFIMPDTASSMIIFTVLSSVWRCRYATWCNNIWSTGFLHFVHES